MDYQELAKRLEGFQTVFSVAKALKISNRTAINYIYALRKKGYLQTSRGHHKIRMYYIKPFVRFKIGYPSMYDIINTYSKIKIIPRYNYTSHYKISIELALIKALKSQDFRIILASLGLFNYVNWSKLYKLAKKENLARNIGALYDVIKKFIRVKKMDKRTRNALLKSEGEKYLIKEFKSKSKDFGMIEKIWKVFIPFNKQDLMGYKE